MGKQRQGKKLKNKKEASAKGTQKGKTTKRKRKARQRSILHTYINVHSAKLDETSVLRTSKSFRGRRG